MNPIEAMVVSTVTLCGVSAYALVKLRDLASTIEMLRKSLCDARDEILQMGWDNYIYLPSENPHAHNNKMLVKEAVYALAKHLNVEMKSTQAKPSEVVIIEHEEPI